MNAEKDNLKKILIITISLIVVVALISMLISKHNEKKNMLKSVNRISSIYYEKYIFENNYNTVILSIKNHTSISTSFYNILRAVGYTEDEVKKTKFYKNCDINNSLVLFFPNGFSKNDFDVELKLKCSF